MAKNRRNTLAGAAYEQELVDKINSLGVFPKVDRTFKFNKELDKKKIDIAVIDKDMEEEFPYILQAKSSTRVVPYPKLLEDMLQNTGTPVLLHKSMERVENDRFLPKEKYAILFEKDFIEIIRNLERYKKAFRELNTYFDSISDEEQPKVHKFLTSLEL